MPDHPADDRPAEVTGLRALAVASELFPLVKTGGLGDVAGALPKALAEVGVEVLSLIPGYPAVLERLNQPRPLRPLPDLFGGAGHLLSARAEDGLALLVIEAPHLYGRAIARRGSVRRGRHFAGSIAKRVLSNHLTSCRESSRGAQCVCL